MRCLVGAFELHLLVCANCESADEAAHSKSGALQDLRAGGKCENIAHLLNTKAKVEDACLRLLAGFHGRVRMERRTTAWFSRNLGMEMPLVAYGHAGFPVLMFPTAAADYLEYERFLLVDAIEPLIEAGHVRAYSINSVNRYSLLNDKASPQLKAELLTRYDHYIVDEVLPLIRQECGGNDGRPITTGASLGAFLSANAYFRHPDLFRGTIAMSGSYDIGSYLKGYTDDNVYFNNPADYLRHLNDDYYLPLLRRADAIYIVSGQGAYEAPDRSRDFSGLLSSRGIPHKLKLWGHDVNHDWPWWRKMLPHYLANMG